MGTEKLKYECGVSAILDHNLSLVIEKNRKTWEGKAGIKDKKQVWKVSQEKFYICLQLKHYTKCYAQLLLECHDNYLWYL